MATKEIKDDGGKGQYIPREIRIRVQRESWGPGLHVYIQGEQCAKHVYLAAGFVVDQRTKEEASTEPYLPRMTDNRAQELMDELWRCGIRPSDGRRTDEAMGALGAHLEDMRKIAFRLFDGIMEDGSIVVNNAPLEVGDAEKP